MRKTSILLLMFLCTNSITFGQNYVQNPSFEDNTAQNGASIDFQTDYISYWSSIIPLSTAHTNLLCEDNGTTISGTDGSYYAEVKSKQLIRNQLSQQVFPGQKLTLQFDTRQPRCNTSDLFSFPILLRNSNRLSSSFIDNLSISEIGTFNASLQWQTKSKSVFVPLDFDPGINFEEMCYFDILEINLSGVSGHWKSALFDNVRLTSCTSQSSDVIYHNFPGNPCTKVNFILDCDLNKKQWFYWEFGDGNSACGPELPEVMHNYSEGGAYTVTLTTIDLEGCKQTVSTSIYVECPGCDIIADFEAECLECKIYDNDNASPGTLVPNSYCKVKFTDLSSSSNLIYWWYWTTNGIYSSSSQNRTGYFSFPPNEGATFEVCLAVLDTEGCADNICKDVSVPCRYRTQRRNENIDNNLNIYPNPSSGIFNIALRTDEPLKNYQILIYDLNGRLVKQLEDYEDSLNLYRNMDLLNIPRGTYYAKVQSETQLFTQKIIITDL